MLFRGLNAINLDAKGRMAIPARHRETIATHCQGKLVVTIEQSGKCLVIYPVNEFEEIQRKVESLPSYDPAAQRLKRIFIGHATDVELDSNGRILLPQELRKYVSLQKKAVMLGQGRKFELWSEEAWDAQREDWLQPPAENEVLSDEMKSISL